MKAFADHFRLRQASVVLLILGLTACSNDPDPEMPTFRGRFSVTGTNVSRGEDGSLHRCNANVSNDVAATNSLEAFINAVEAQRGNKLTNAQADESITAAQEIQALLNCGN